VGDLGASMRPESIVLGLLVLTTEHIISHRQARAGSSTICQRGHDTARESFTTSTGHLTLENVIAWIFYVNLWHRSSRMGMRNPSSHSKKKASALHRQAF